MAGSKTISASEFKAKCLDILDRIRSRDLERVVATKRGVPVAILVPPPAESVVHGFLRGSVVVPPGFDLTVPTGDEAFATEEAARKDNL
jgi:antitoxin (DNA-binding transcriptional repressor) of toxin-antitoxin stability system